MTEPMSKQSPIEPALVRELAELLAATDLSEIEVEKGDLRIRVEAVRCVGEWGKW